MQPDQLIALVIAHKWIAVAAVLIGAIVRALKQDTPIPITIVAKYRPWLALGLGQVSGVLQALSTGTPWKEALVGGLVSSVVAILGHDLVIESMRNGKELGAPKVPPLPVLLLLVVGCGPAQPGAQSPARDYARAAILLVSEGVKVADQVCADVALAKKDFTVAKTCADAYETARSSLLAAQTFVDAWEDGAGGSYVCTLAH